MKPLDQIGFEQNTDKSSLWHNYLSAYEMFFWPLRDKPVNFLEIGVYAGASLRTWEEYFPKAKIFGWDIEDKSDYDTKRTKTYNCDATNMDQISATLQKMPDLDIIMDDSSHLSKDMIFMFENLFPVLNGGGLYIMEDLLTCYNPTFCPPEEFSGVDRVKQMVGEIQMNGNIISLRSDKTEALMAMSGTYYERNIEWIHVGCGYCVIKKMK